ncbi:hypothetical protein [Chelatococcus reniformis]|uniref:Uncharacterized protein n=1 Tax=Chelatococcus reniformis TaxID=1494448 RepID=A0A916UR43_9HYPH|nr:hypothetical protein [Chelatococcus reniformis]GGC82644.1 hypothetical protein GCM10010994_45680 [Chelatococcus reniformis]
MTLARRRSFAAFLATVVMCVLSLVPARAAPTAAGGYSHVSIDVSVLEAQGLGPMARFVGAQLHAQMRRQFAGRLGVRGAPAILVRLTGLSLPSYVGGSGLGFGGRRGGGVGSDFLEGDTLVIARSGAVIYSQHILTNLPSSSGGAWYDPDVDAKRIAAICGAYAGWSYRYVTGR